jgi:hypothetical protein
LKEYHHVEYPFSSSNSFAKDITMTMLVTIVPLGLGMLLLGFVLFMMPTPRPHKP